MAKILKERGIISKQAKLHGGHFISRGVLNKVREYENAARLGYKAVPVSRAVARAAQERGYQVVQGNRIIGPSTPQFRNRLKSGLLTGVKPVKGGYMEEVTLPHNVYDMRTLVEQLQSGIDTLKMPDEQFAFKYKGHESYRAFMNSEDMLEKLMQYKPIIGALSGETLEDEFQNLVIFRLHRNDISRVMISEKARKAAARKRNPRKRKNSKLLDRVAVAQVNRDAILAERAKNKAARKLDNIRNDPVRFEKYKALRRKTAKESYQRRKGK